MSDPIHSPLPWRASGEWEIVDANGEEVASCWDMYGPGALFDEEGFGPTPVIPGPVNRALVLRAVNAHAALVALAQAYQEWEADLILNGDWSGACVRMTQAQHDRMLELQGMRNAALKLAKER